MLEPLKNLPFGSPIFSMYKYQELTTNFCNKRKKVGGLSHIRTYKVAFYTASPYYTELIADFNMRIRYWRLTTEDMFLATYPLEWANHWEIKCLQGEYEHFGVFWYRYGTPYDKEPVYGLAVYYNDIPKSKVDELIEMLHGSFGGEILHRQSRIFLNGSKEFTDPQEIAKLANDIGERFKGPVEITIEFEEISKDDRQGNLINLPPSKLLEIPGLR